MWEQFISKFKWKRQFSKNGNYLFSRFQKIQSNKLHPNPSGNGKTDLRNSLAPFMSLLRNEKISTILFALCSRQCHKKSWIADLLNKFFVISKLLYTLHLRHFFPCLFFWIFHAIFCRILSDFSARVSVRPKKGRPVRW